MTGYKTKIKTNMLHGLTINKKKGEKKKKKCGEKKERQNKKNEQKKKYKKIRSKIDKDHFKKKSCRETL